MACGLTKGRAIDCRDGFGGIEQVLISEFNNVSTFTATAGVVTALTQVVATNFFIYELEKANGSLVETHTGSIDNNTNVYDSVLEFTTKKISALENEELNLLDKNRLFIIVKDMNGKYWTMGAYYGADKLGGTSVTGAAAADMNGYTYSFSAQEKVRMLEVNAATIAALTTSA